MSFSDHIIPSYQASAPPPPTAAASQGRDESSAENVRETGATTMTTTMNQVEWATLTLPAEALVSGGDATDADATMTTTVATAAAAAATTVSHDDDGDNYSKSDNIIDHNMATTATTQIQAVVDLEKLSELVGMGNDEFVAELHREVHEQQQQQSNATPHDIESGGEIGLTRIGETAPLLPSAPVAPTDRVEGVAAETNTTITLPADPFVECLHNVMAADDLDDTSTLLETTTIVTDVRTAAATATTAAAVSGGDEEDDDDDHQQHHHYTHDAFLLEIPNVPTHHGGEIMSTKGEQQHQQQPETQNRFVLALPEILLPDQDGVISEMSNDDEHGYFTPLVERIFSTLPTDVQQVNLQVATTTTTTVLPAKESSFDEEEQHRLSKQQQQPDTAGGVATTTTEVLHLDLVVKRKAPIIGYVILVMGLLGLSSVGAALNLQGGTTINNSDGDKAQVAVVSPYMKTFWRLSSTSVVLLPLALKSLWHRDGSSSKHHHDSYKALPWTQLWLFPLAAFSYAFATTTFVVALQMTSLANAFVLSNMTSLVIIAGKFLLGLPILVLEAAGTVIGFLGGAICADDVADNVAANVSAVVLSDGSGDDFSSEAIVSTAGRVLSTLSSSSSSSEVLDKKSIKLLGDFIALSSSFGMAGYLVLAKKLRTSVDLFVFMFFLMTFSSIFVLAFMVFFTNETVQLWSRDPIYGLWGWTIANRWDRLPLELFMAIVCNVLGTTGYIAVLKYFDAVVVSTVMLMEPVVGALMGVASGTDPLPDTQVWIGDVVVALGCFLVIWSGSKKTESIDATEALRTTTASEKNK